MNNQQTRRGNTQEGRAAKNKVILNLIQDLQRLPLLLPLINNLRGRSHIKYGMTPLFDNNGCVKDAQQQPLSIRLFNEKHKKNTFISPLTWATLLLSPTGEGPKRGDSFPMRGKVAEGRMRGIRSVLPQPGLHPTYKGSSARAVTPQGRYAGYSGRIGFTLIELLVVVLIIGILAAVAVPQYQNAVRKAQGREVHVAIDTLDKALADYYLEHGNYLQAGCPVTQEGLNIEIPTLKHFYFLAKPYPWEERPSSSFLKLSFINDNKISFGYCVTIRKDDTGLQVGTATRASVEVCWKDGRLQFAACGPVEICRKYFEGEEIEIQLASSTTTEFHLKTPAQD